MILMQRIDQHTQLLELSLVALALDDGFLLGLGLGGLVLEGEEEAVTLGGAGGLESVLLAVDLEDDLAAAILGQIGDLALDKCQYVRKSHHLLMNHIRG